MKINTYHQYFSLEQFIHIKEIKDAKTPLEAYGTAFEIASQWSDSAFNIPTLREFEKWMEDKEIQHV